VVTARARAGPATRGMVATAVGMSARRGRGRGGDSEGEGRADDEGRGGGSEERATALGMSARATALAVSAMTSIVCQRCPVCPAEDLSASSLGT
jgi:hypothetical protein